MIENLQNIYLSVTELKIELELVNLDNKAITFSRLGALMDNFYLLLFYQCEVFSKIVHPNFSI